MRRGWFLIAVLAAGCAKPGASAPSEAGAVAQAYFDAIVRQDWPAAYSHLHADAKSRWQSDAFRSAAEHFRRHLGAQPESVHLSSCEEHGDEAVAHLLIVGHANGKPHTLREAVALRRSTSGWGVVPPPRFGVGR
ncbi:MAG: hypothetical protein ACJ8F7_18145 [Gemmataceae bacterium]